MVRNQSIRNLLELPIELIELIMTYVSYDEIAKIRAVCRAFDSCSQRLLNRGFVRVEKYHSLCFKKVKSQLPRRESERRSHPLARHCDVLSAIETRLSLLGMTYMKYVDLSLCCFIPGKVIDEIYRVLRFIQNNPNPPRVHELLQELRDISSMAMEYFEEKIAPSLKSKLSSSNNVMTAVVPLTSPAINSCRSLPSTSNSNQIYSTPRLSPFSADQDLLKSNQSLIKQMQTSQNTIKKEFNDIKVQLKDFSTIKRELTSVKSKLREWERSSNEKDQMIAELKAQLEDLKRRMTEYDKKSGIKTIKDEQHVQKETKTAKRKTTRRSNRGLNVKEENDLSIDDNVVEEPEIDAKKSRKTRSFKKSELKDNIQTNVKKTITRNAKSKWINNPLEPTVSKRKRINNLLANERQKRVKNI